MNVHETYGHDARYTNGTALDIVKYTERLAESVIRGELEKDIMKGKVVVELGAGCGLPALAAGDSIVQCSYDYFLFIRFLLYTFGITLFSFSLFVYF